MKPSGEPPGNRTPNPQIKSINPLFSESYEGYVSHRVASGKRRKSYYLLWAFWNRYVGHFRLDDITAADITTALDVATTTRGWCQATRTHALHVLESFYRWACDPGRRLASHIPTLLVPRLTGQALENPRDRYLSDHELARLLEVCSIYPILHDLVLFSATLNTRLQETFDRRVDEVHQQAGTWRLTYQVGKTGMPRDIELVGVVRKMVLRNRAASIERGSPWLFSGPKGGQLQKRIVYDNLPGMCRLAGIEYDGRSKHGFSFHCLRKTFATRMYNRTGDWKLTQHAGAWKTSKAMESYGFLDDKRVGEALKASQRRLDRRPRNESRTRSKRRE